LLAAERHGASYQDDDEDRDGELCAHGALSSSYESVQLFNAVREGLWEVFADQRLELAAAVTSSVELLRVERLDSTSGFRGIDPDERCLYRGMAVVPHVDDLQQKIKSPWVPLLELAQQLFSVRLRQNAEHVLVWKLREKTRQLIPEMRRRLQSLVHEVREAQVSGAG
jgi:hypothetical protein